MSLRVRFALYAFVVVALALGTSGLALRQALQAFLLRQVDGELRALLDAVARRLTPDEDGILRLDLDAELFSFLTPDTLVLLVGPEGIQDALGLLPPQAQLEALARGEGGDYRVQAAQGDQVRVLVARHLGGVRQVVALVDRLLPLVLLLGGGVATLLAFSLSSQALAPLARATRAALDLARERAWNRRLPLSQRPDEVGQVVEAFNQALEALEEVLNAERRFAQEAAHALRTPLTVLLGHLERGRLEEARVQAERLRELVEQLLLLARAEVDALARTLLELDTLVFTEAEALRPAFQARGLQLAVDLPEAPTYVLANEQALRAIVVALLENALRHTAKGGRVRVKVRGAVLWMYNAPSHPAPGTGLGLRLVETLVRAQGGSLQVVEEGGGFLVMLHFGAA
ncbi:sensor histidine kinase [Thermus sediminis]|uniref:sensor histidine kinase n=1 Tax=Thermus sediminis TaxID=1761908 RepID=UPI000E3EBECE|nr:HAMP domain-containing protein [Thermus sediminis]